MTMRFQSPGACQGLLYLTRQLFLILRAALGALFLSHIPNLDIFYCIF